ncbi:MAG TPA: thiamine pyrophosphate-dependent enzyme [Planctomycetota bacterium]|nr:thiamine pyrophosphate-dependent enzyme [Planctomycetota bacterium]
MAAHDLPALRDFLALEAPWLLPRAQEILALRRLPDGAVPQGDDRPLWPGTSGAEAAGWTRVALAEQVAGFFRRRELRASLTPEERREMHRVMVLSRTLDDRLKRLHAEKAFGSPQKGFRALGQEAAVGLSLRLRRGREDGDVVSPLIRGLPLLLMSMDDPLHVVRVQAGKKGTPMDGRDLHVGDLARGVLPPAAPLAIGAQTLVGMAYAAQLRREDRVFLSVMGEGGTSLGEWHEAVNFAAVRRLAIVFVVENNRWALGTHWREQTAAPRFALKAAGYGIPGITVFGNDPDEVAAAAAWAVERARAGKGPALLELSTYRRSGHAHHDDDRFHGAGPLPGYEIAQERALWEKADPIELYERRLKEEGLLDDRLADEVRATALRRVEEAVRTAEADPWPSPEDLADRVFAPRIDPVTHKPGQRVTRPMSYDEAVRDALATAMRADPRVVVIGEDVGGRYGGAFGVTRGLAKEFGEARCLNAPLAESAIVGCGVGAALAGLRPVVEMQFADFLACGFNALVNNAAKVRWRWGRAVPLVVRLPYGTLTAGERLLGSGPFHGQCPEAWFLRTPGWKVVAPATPADARGLLLAAIRDNNPVVFLEAKGLYGVHRPDLKEDVPTSDVEVPIGTALVRREGRDATILTYGTTVWTALEAATRLSEEGVDVEVVDLRSLVPLDEKAIRASVAKTSRVVVLHEDSRRGGVGAEIAALIAETCFWDLDGPVVRIGALDVPPPYAPTLEKAYLPDVGRVVEGVKGLLGRKP